MSARTRLIARTALLIAVSMASAAARGQAPPPAAGTAPVRARIWFGGDVQLERNRRGSLAAVPAIVGGAPGIVNLEGPIAQAPAAGPGLRLVNPPSAPQDLAAAGVRVATLANNHARDAGPMGERTTARALAARGVLAAGPEIGPARLTVAGTRLAIVARDLADPELARPASFDDELRRARSGADALVVSYHVTGPPSYLPAQPVVRAVDRALAAGASVVVVHGSHVLGRVERRGRALIAWGLGNLAFACDCTRESEAVLLEVEISAAGAGRAQVIPIAAGLVGAPVAAAPDAAGILDLLEALGSPPLVRAGDRASF